jgi:hypothetical protein
MKTGIEYLYSGKPETLVKKGDRQFTRYTVFRVNVFNNDRDEAERKARTINDKMGFEKMPGGCFLEKTNFKETKDFLEEYEVIPVPDKTKIQPYNDHDKFIIGLIEAENNMEYVIL